MYNIDANINIEIDEPTRVKNILTNLFLAVKLHVPLNGTKTINLRGIRKIEWKLSNFEDKQSIELLNKGLDSLFAENIDGVVSCYSNDPLFCYQSREELLTNLLYWFDCKNSSHIYYLSLDNQVEKLVDNPNNDWMDSPFAGFKLKELKKIANELGVKEVKGANRTKSWVDAIRENNQTNTKPN